MRVYLAGGFYGDYKKEAIGKLVYAGLEVYDPEAENKDLPATPAYFVNKDLEAIKNSQILLAYFDEYPWLYGTAAEIGYAHAQGVHVFIVFDRPRIDSFLSGLAKSAFTNMDSAVDHIIKRYAPAKYPPETMITKAYLEGRRTFPLGGVGEAWAKMMEARYPIK